MNQSEYQREAMRKYMEELNTHTTKIVEKPPQTELNRVAEGNKIPKKIEKLKEKSCRNFAYSI